MISRKQNILLTLDKQPFPTRHMTPESDPVVGKLAFEQFFDWKTKIISRFFVLHFIMDESADSNLHSWVQ